MERCRAVVGGVALLAVVAVANPAIVRWAEDRPLSPPASVTATAGFKGHGTMAGVRVFGAHAVRGSDGFYAPDNVTKQPPAWFVSFRAGQRFSFVLQGSGYRLRVDGNVTPLLKLPGSGHNVVRVKLRKPARHEVVVEMDYGDRFGGVIGTRQPSKLKLGPRTIALGDSYTAGTGSSANFTGYAQTALFSLGIGDVWAAGVGGSGYVTPGPLGVTFGQRLDHDVIRWKPKIVIVAGGINDPVDQPSQVGAAASDVFRRIRAGLPSAKLIVVGPWAPRQPNRLVAIDNAIREAAAANGAIFVSTLGWITDANRGQYIGADGIHPNRAGHRYLGHRLAAALAGKL